MSAPVVPDLHSVRNEFRSELLASGLLIDAGKPGLYGRSGLFDDIVDSLDGALTGIMAPLDAERMRFAPVYPKTEFELTDYIVSFPNLTGSINGFTGTDRDHASLITARANGEDWNDWLSPAETMLVPAVCHPLYERLSGSLPVGGRVFDLAGYCFRHEPSSDPMRLQAFRMHEFVYVGEEETAREFRDTWIVRLLVLLQELGLDARTVPANDPFFGRAGRMLARNQLADDLKLELVVPIYGDLDDGTAVGSGNCHGDHFGQSFGILAGDGSVAHGACVAYGMERVTLALLRTHGFEPASWPSDVRKRLGWAA
jgi:seryl-tRNA synthetase